MMTYVQLFSMVLPVFLLVALGAVLSRAKWLPSEAEDALFQLIVRVLMPCLIFESVTSAGALRDPANLLGAPLAGFSLTLLGIGTAWLVGRWLGLHNGTGLRTFALVAGIANYGYLPLPLMEGLFGPESRGLLLLHNAGVETAIWTGGILVISGLSPREGWRKLLNMPLLALLLALTVNLLGGANAVPDVVTKIIHWLGQSAVPLGLLMTGASIQPHLGDPGKLWETRLSLAACLVRLAVLPAIFLVIARYGPFTPEMRQVLAVQAAMPCAVIPIIIARIYGGQAMTAVQIVIVTTSVALFTIPLWLRIGLEWVAR